MYSHAVTCPSLRHGAVSRRPGATSRRSPAPPFLARTTQQVRTSRRIAEAARGLLALANLVAWAATLYLLPL
jgi:hypothetical protein